MNTKEKGALYTRAMQTQNKGKAMNEPRPQSQRGHVQSLMLIPNLLTFPHFAQILHIEIAPMMPFPQKHSLHLGDLLNLGTVPGANHSCGKIGFRHADAIEAVQ